MLDVIIVGGGVAGLTAGLYANRGGLSTLLFERMFPGGQASTTGLIENYPGFDEPISGPDLVEKMENQAQKFGLKILYDEVTGLDLEGRTKKVEAGGKTYECKAVILAMGAEPRQLGLEKEKEFRGKGISYCATCDGAFYKGKDVVVVGGGDTAAEDAMFLSRYVRKAYLVHRRDTLRASRILADRVLARENVEMVWSSEVEAILGENRVTGVRTVDRRTGKKREIRADGIFIAIGVHPNSEGIPNQVPMSRSGYVITNESMQAGIPGVFAAGDLRQKPLLQLVTAASDGAVAAVSAQRYIMKEFMSE